MFEKITVHTPRQFVPADLNTGDWAALAPLFEQLEQQLSAAADAASVSSLSAIPSRSSFFVIVPFPLISR